MRIRVLVLFIQTTWLALLAKADLTSLPSHLKPIGSGPSRPIEVFDGFPKTKHFFEDYVLPMKPLLMKGAAKLSTAYEMWEDDYFLKLIIPDKVVVESKKKENRKAPATEMYFKEFVMVYNRTDQYMVNPTPNALAADIVLPTPLQCKQIIEDDMLLENMMWFSSGGTKSVLHTDSVENINCLFRGRKTFVMIDPTKYVDKVDMDHPEGSYCGVDVDRVDYTKYPGLAEVEFVNVEMDAGDCLYIPYMWIHHVRSFGRNIAVNLWWDYHKNKEVDLDKCAQEEFDENLTLDKIEYLGLDHLMNDLPAIRESLITYARQGPLTQQVLKEYFVENMEEEFLNQQGGVLSLLDGIIAAVDVNKDGQATLEEVQSSSDEDFEKVQKIFLQLQFLLKKMEEEYLSSQDPERFVVDDDLSREEL